MSLPPCLHVGVEREESRERIEKRRGGRTEEIQVRKKVEKTDPLSERGENRRETSEEKRRKK